MRLLKKKNQKADILNRKIIDKGSRTFLVSNQKEGDFHYIKEALKIARPEDTIVFKRGIYTEPFDIVKGVTIRGEGEVVFDGKINILSGIGRTKLGNITFRQTVSVAGGMVSFENCGFLSREETGLEIENGLLKICDCRFEENGKGLLIGENAFVEVKRVFFLKNEVGILNRGTVFLSESRLLENKTAVLVGKKGILDMKYSTVSKSKLGVIADGNLNMENSTLFQNKEGSVLILKNGKGFLKKNEFLDHGNYHISVAGKADILENRLVKSKNCSIKIAEKGMATVCENVIRNIDGIGILVRGNGDIINNTVAKTKRSAVLVAEKGKSFIYSNEIEENDHNGIEVRGEADIRENRIFQNGYTGIDVEEKGSADIFQNRIVNQKGYGVVLKGACKRSNNILKDNKVNEMLKIS